MDTKTCRKCRRNQDIDQFDFRIGADGRRRRKVTCRSCLSRETERIQSSRRETVYDQGPMNAVFAVWRAL